VGYGLDATGLITNRHLIHAGASGGMTDYFYYDAGQRLVYALMGVTNALPPASGAVPPGCYGRTFEYNSLDIMTNSTLLNPYQLSLPTFGGFVGNNFDDNLFVQGVTYSGASTVQRGADEAGNTTQGMGFARARVPDSSQVYPGSGFTASYA